jgi:hypothetical protein
MMMHALLRGAGAAILICTLTPAAHAQTPPGAGSSPAECRTAKPKKHPFGLGGLLSAARRAGVGDMLNNRMGGGMFGNGKGGQIAGAIAGTAVEAASASAQASANDQGAADAASCTPAQGAGQ